MSSLNNGTAAPVKAKRETPPRKKAETNMVAVKISEPTETTLKFIMDRDGDKSLTAVVERLAKAAVMSPAPSPAAAEPAVQAPWPFPAAKTPSLPSYALADLQRTAHAPVPIHSIDSRSLLRFRKDGLTKTVKLRSKLPLHKGTMVDHEQITPAGESVVAAARTATKSAKAGSK